MGSHRFSVTAIGPIDVSIEGLGVQRLSPANRHFLALLIAAGPSGITSTDLARERDDSLTSDSSIRMAAARLRKRLGDELVPHADDGLYRLVATADAVDVWFLEQTAVEPIDHVDVDVIQHLVRPATPFDGVPKGELLEQAERRVTRLQRDLLIRWIDDRPDSIPVRLVDAIVEHVRGDPLDEPLLIRASSCLARAGRRDDALRLFGDAHRAFAETGLTLGAAAEQVERGLLHGAFPSEPEMAMASVPDRRTTMPSQLRARLTGRYVGEGHELGVLRSEITAPGHGVTSMLLSGPSGAGKTRVCAEAAVVATEHSWVAMMLSPSRFGSQAPFAPLLAAMPDLGEVVESFASSTDEPNAARIRSWNSIREALDRRRGAAPMLIVVDDAQWLDQETADFLAHISSATLDGRMLLLINGRDDPTQSGHWPQLRAHFRAIGASQVDVRPLDIDAIRAFVDDRRPSMSGPLLESVAHEVLDRSSGLPGLAGPLLAAIPPGSVVVPTMHAATGQDALLTTIATLSDAARITGIAAAALNVPCRIDTLSSITELSEESVFDAVDELLDRGLLIDQSVAEFEVAHLLVQQALLSSAGAAQLARIHLRSAELVPDDLNRRAHHLAAAVPLASIDDAVDALVMAASTNVAVRSHRDAIRQFQLADSLRADALTASQLGMYARALDLSGMHLEAREQRQRGVDLAERSDAWHTMLEVATSGLPEVEMVLGNPDLVADLLRIDATRLSRADAWRHAVTVAKQLNRVGRHEEGMTFAERAAAIARSPAEVVGAATVRRTVMAGRTPPEARIAVLEAVIDESSEIDEELLGDYLLNLSLDQYGAGATRAAQHTVERLEQVAGRSVVKVWQSMLMRAMFAADRGDSEELQSLRVAAHSYAVQYGLGEADSALLASMFVETWLAGESVSLLDEVDGGVLDPSLGLVAQSGAAAILFDAGQHERAAAVATDAANFVLGMPVSHRLEALAMVSEPLAAVADSDMRERVRQTFIDAGDSMLIIGAGVTNMGPVTRYLARFAVDAAERDALLRQSLALAERSGSTLWCDITTRDLHTARR